MVEVVTGVWVSGQAGCVKEYRDGYAYVHACKQPCHQQVAGNPDASHPHYLSLEQGNHLYLNLVDPKVPIFKVGSFTTFREFARRKWNENNELVIHCNQGKSRSPSLALLFLAKELGVLPAESFEHAALAFGRKCYAAYNPGRGIARFMSSRWADL